MELTNKQKEKELNVKAEPLDNQIIHSLAMEILEQNSWQLDLENLLIISVAGDVEKILGYKSEELRAQPVKLFVSPSSYRKFLELLPRFMEVADRRVNKKFKLRCVIEQKGKNGKTVLTETAICFFKNLAGRYRMLGVSRMLEHSQVLKDALRQVAESEEFLQLAWDAAPCMLSYVNRKGQLLLINKKFAENTSLDKDNAIGQSFYEIVPNELKEKHKVLFAECLTGKVVNFIDPCHKEDNLEKCWLFGQYNPVYSDDGKVEKVVAALTDMTELYEMKKQLLETEKIGKTGSWYWNLEKQEFKCSDGFLNLLAIQRQEIIQQGLKAVLGRFSPEMQRQVLKWGKLEQVIEKLKVGLEIALVLPDRTRSLIWVSGEVRNTDKGKPIEIYGIVVDITNQRKLEIAKKDAEIRLREFSRAMPGLGMIVEASGTIIDIFDDNNLLGVNSRELVGKNFQTWVADTLEEQLMQALDYVIKQKMLRFEQVALEVNGDYKNFDVRIAPLSYNLNGNATVALYWTDITDQNRTKRLLELNYEQQRQSELLNDLLEGKILPSQEFLDKAWQAKLNLTIDFSCYLIQLQTKHNSDCLSNTTEKLQTVCDILMSDLAKETGGIVWKSRDGVVLLLPVETNEIRSKEQELAQAKFLENVLQHYIEPEDYGIGIAEFQTGTFWQFTKVYDQARIAVQLGKKLGLKKSIYHYKDIGVLQFFTAIENKTQIIEFIERTLGNLEKYERVHGTELIETLDKIIHIDNLRQVAEVLYVHRQTILFRKQRIEKILGISLDIFENRLSLAMALKFKKIYAQDS